MDFRTISVAGALLACACEVGEARPDEGGQSGTAIPDGCYEDHRVGVDDLDGIPEGFPISAADTIATVAGEWAGSGELGTGEPIDATFTVEHDLGPVEAVYTEWREGREGAGLGEPASTPICEPFYAFGVVTSLDADPWVSGDGEGPVYTVPGGAWFTAQTPLDEVVGSLQPGFDTTAWDDTWLAATWTAGAPATLTLEWWGTNEPQEQAAAASTATTTSTGTIEPSATTEPIATMAVSR